MISSLAPTVLSSYLPLVISHLNFGMWIFKQKRKKLPWSKHIRQELELLDFHVMDYCFRLAGMINLWRYGLQSIEDCSIRSNSIRIG